MSEKRAMDDGPFAWFNKEAVRHIRRMCDPSKSEVDVYLALCEVASNHCSDNFVASLGEIGGLCGITSRTVLGRCVNQLEFIGLLEVQRHNKLRMPSAFKLLRCEVKERKKRVVHLDDNDVT